MDTSSMKLHFFLSFIDTIQGDQLSRDWSLQKIFQLEDLTSDPINTKITHIEQDFQNPLSIIYSVYYTNRTGNGKTGLGEFSTDNSSPLTGVFVESSSPSDLWGFTQIDTQYIVIVDRDQHCFRIYERLTGQLRPLAGTCGHSQNCYSCERYYYPFDVIYHRESKTIYHTDGFRRRVRSLGSLGRTQLVTRFEFPVRQFDPLSSILVFNPPQSRILVTFRKPKPSNEIRLRMITIESSKTVLRSDFTSIYSFAEAGEAFFINDETVIQGSVLNEIHIEITSEGYRFGVSSSLISCGFVTTGSPKRLVVADNRRFLVYEERFQKSNQTSSVGSTLSGNETLSHVIDQPITTTVKGTTSATSKTPTPTTSTKPAAPATNDRSNNTNDLLLVSCIMLGIVTLTLLILICSCGCCKRKDKSELRNTKIKLAAVQQAEKDRNTKIIKGYPNTWSGDVSGYSEEIISSDSEEYLSVRKRFINSLKITAVVKQITRIQNPVAYYQYRIHKHFVQTKLESRNRDDITIERELWHGTREENVGKITQTNFDRSRTGRFKYGCGAYFAATAEYSHSYTVANLCGDRHMMLVSVITGDHCLGTQSMKTLPYISGSTTEQYDSATNSLNNPAMFVVFHDTAAYPMYVIRYSTPAC